MTVSKWSETLKCSEARIKLFEDNELNEQRATTSHRILKMPVALNI